MPAFASPPGLCHHGSFLGSPAELQRVSRNTTCLPWRHRRGSVARTRQGIAQCSAGDPSPLTERVTEFLSRATEGAPLEGLKRADAAYAALVTRGPPRSAGREPVRVVLGSAPEANSVHDVVVAGGTLGLVLARALQTRGLRVAVVERGRAVGRAQEWNVSRHELQTLIALGVLSEEEVEEAIVSEWPSGRVSFHSAPDGGATQVEVLDAGPVLNVGISPARLIATVRDRFEGDGGVLMEGESIESVDVFDDAVVLSTARTAGGGGGDGASGAGGGAAPPQVTSRGRKLHARLLVDCMGSFSRLAAQAHNYARPDGVCVTVGACCDGPFTAEGADVVAAVDGISLESGQQSFWEAFPAAGGDGPPNARRTTYMFQYGDCDAQRPSLGETLDEYLGTVGKYQGVDVDNMRPVRVLFGFFPAFRASPLRTPFPRIFFAGDAGGTQSPVSFGGFAALLRHMPRLATALPQAVTSGALSVGDLSRLSPYLPGQSASWMFAKSMSARGGTGQMLGRGGIVQAFRSNMVALARRPADQRAFLQDAVQAGGLAWALLGMMASQPVLALRLTRYVGAGELARFLGHFVALALYAALDRAAQAADVRGERTDLPFAVRRAAEAFLWGSGRDHLRSTLDDQTAASSTPAGAAQRQSM